MSGVGLLVAAGLAVAACNSAPAKAQHFSAGCGERRQMEGRARSWIARRCNHDDQGQHRRQGHDLRLGL